MMKVPEMISNLIYHANIYKIYIFVGEYCCRAFNSCGAATSRCYVRVKGVNAPPSAPSCVEIVDANRDFVVISWKSPGYVGYFGGSPVLGYAIEM